MFTDKWMIKENGAYKHNEILFSSKKKWQFEWTWRTLCQVQIMQARETNSTWSDANVEFKELIS